MRNRFNFMSLLFMGSLLLCTAHEAYAQNYRFPLTSCGQAGGCYVTAYFDLNRGGGVVRDWNCKTKTYDQHSGTDYGIGGFAGMDANGSRPIVAAAQGTVIATADGYYDRQTTTSGNSNCGSSTSCGNYVQLSHADGKKTIYCHMKKGTIKVSKGQTVSCGQELGRVGSSGCSTGPHLHFGVNVPGYGSDDPYKATSGCGGNLTYWVSQGGYLGLPATDCDCKPNCSGRACGDNGCGGSCGACPANHACSNYQCVCQPQCSGKACGDNGCGGSCGSCPSTHTCSGNQCVCTPQCSGKVCGDNGCGGSCGNCAANQRCDGGKCVCVPNCDGKACGDDGCGGSCGTCPATHSCSSNQCVCTPKCAGKECGDDGCGGVCGSCFTGFECVNSSCQCIPSCEGKDCGSDGCGALCGTCEKDSVCEAGRCSCTADCNGKECGDDGCWGSCGECDAGSTCQEGRCRTCTPKCSGKTCGDDGCGGTCGTCPEAQTCNQQGVCECTPQCSGKVCGDNACGGVCGQCPETAHCNDSGLCIDNESGEEVDPAIEEGVQPQVTVSPDSCSCQTHTSPKTPQPLLWIVSFVVLSLLYVRRKRVKS